MMLYQTTGGFREVVYICLKPHPSDVIIAPKAHFQLAAELSRSRDFACSLTVFVCLSVWCLLQGLMLIYLATDAVELAKIEATW